MVSVQCYMFVCRLVISVQGVIIIDLSSLGCIVPEILKAQKSRSFSFLSQTSRPSSFYFHSLSLISKLHI